jgi:hypothetical protein
MAKMNTIKHLAAGQLNLENGGDVARIERNLFSNEKGDTFEAIRFCKTRNGRHNRVHLVIGEDDFAELFRDAVRQGVFHESTLEMLFQALEEWHREEAPRRSELPNIVGLFRKGSLSNQQIDELLYGEFQK